MALWMRSLGIWCHREKGQFPNLTTFRENWAEQIGWSRMCVYSCTAGSSVVHELLLKRSSWKNQTCFWRWSLNRLYKTAKQVQCRMFPLEGLWQWLCMNCFPLNLTMQVENTLWGSSATCYVESYWHMVMELLLNILKPVFLCRMNCIQLASLTS